MFRFTIIDYTTNPSGDSTVIDEPLGFAELELVINRDDKLKGVFFYPESFNNLTFYGESATILQDAYSVNGIAAHCEMTIEFQCDDSSAFVEIARLKFDFSDITKICDDFCKLEIGLDDASCVSTLRNRWETKVNLDSLKSLDSTTDNLTNYTALGGLCGTQAAAIEYNNNWEMKPGDHTNPSLVFDHVDQNNPALPYSIYDTYFLHQTFPYNEISTNLQIANIDPYYVGYAPQPGFPPVQVPVLPPNLEYTDNYLINCSGNLTIEINMSGGVNAQSSNSPTGSPVMQLTQLRPNSVGTAYQEIQNITLVNFPNYNTANTYSDGFNVTGTYNFVVQPGDIFNLKFSVYNLQYTSGSGGGAVYDPMHFEIFFDAGSYMKMKLTSVCENTFYNCYLINETLSRISESLTNDCLRVYSEYYGRTDSQPYSTEETGCGGLRSLTNGLLLRQTKLVDDSEPNFVLSMKDAFNGLYPIDNIGMGMETDPNRTGYDLLRIEPKEYFYQNVQIADLSGSRETTLKLQPKDYIQNLKFGYNLWETESTLGLDDIHSQREYRSTLSNISNTLELITLFVASHYAIEYTRREIGKSLYDYKYDNEVFIIQNRRKFEIDPDGDYEFIAETYFDNVGNILQSFSDILQPQFRRNIRLSPLRNILRHLKDLLRTYHPNPNGEFQFTAGTGNYIAKIQYLGSVPCLLEIHGDPLWDGLSESQTISINLLDDPNDGLPYEQNVVIEFQIPMSFNTYLTIKNNPYGYVKYSCADGYSFGWIKQIRYNPSEGMASVQLTEKN